MNTMSPEQVAEMRLQIEAYDMQEQSFEKRYQKSWRAINELNCHLEKMGVPPTHHLRGLLNALTKEMEQYNYEEMQVAAALSSEEVNEPR